MTVTSASPDWDMVARQGSYWATSYKRTWKGSVVTAFVMPLLYVLAMGVLLGGFVRTGADLDGRSDATSPSSPRAWSPRRRCRPRPARPPGR